MKKKVISLFLSTVMLLCILTGCIHQDMGVKMNKDGTGSITTTVGVEKSFYEQLVAMGSDPFDGKTVTEYQYDGSTYVAYAETKEYNSYEDMERALLELTYETEMLDDAQNAESEDVPENDSDDVLAITVSDEKKSQTNNEATPEKDNHIFSSVNIEKNSGIFYTTYTFHAVMNPQDGEGLDYDLNDTFKVTLSVEMPADITSSKGGTAEGKKIVFDIADITESQELSAMCEENNATVMIGIVIALVALVAGMFALIKFKK